MTFCSKEQNENEIISRVEKFGDSYIIKYLDDSITNYYNSDYEHYSKLEEKMIEQAKKRDELEYDNISLNKWCSLLISILNLNIMSKSLNNGLLFISCLSFCISAFFIYKYRENKKNLKELKKYRILLNNYNELKNNIEITKAIEFESLFREAIDIFNIDKYSLGQMKIIEKELKKQMS